MAPSRNLHPVVILDKNGKQTTVYKKLPGQGATPANNFSLLPRAITPSPENKQDQIEGIVDAADDLNAEYGYQYISHSGLESALMESSVTEVALIAEAVESYERFTELLVHAVVSPDEVASFAVVYSPEFASNLSINQRIMVYSRAVDEAHKYLSTSHLNGLWDLSEEDEATRTQARRFVAVWCTVNGGEKMNAFSFEVPHRDILDRTRDANDDEYADIMEILRSNPAATASQIDFVLRGGPSGISSGAL